MNFHLQDFGNFLLEFYVSHFYGIFLSNSTKKIIFILATLSTLLILFWPKKLLSNSETSLFCTILPGLAISLASEFSEYCFSNIFKIPNFIYKFLIKIGDISYVLYLVHWPILSLISCKFYQYEFSDHGIFAKWKFCQGHFVKHKAREKIFLTNRKFAKR